MTDRAAVDAVLDAFHAAAAAAADEEAIRCDAGELDGVPRHRTG